MKKRLPWILLTLLFILLILFGVFVFINRDSINETVHFGSTKKNVGLYVEELTEFYSLEERPQIMEWFEYWLQDESKEKLAACGVRHEAFPLITWMPNDISFEDIINGVYDDYVTEYLKRKVTVCSDIDVLIRFAHEMEVRPNYRFKWYTWQNAGPELYIEAFRHLVTLSRKISPNIKWIWSPNRCDEYSLPYYPGDEYVDFVGITMDLELTHFRRYKAFQDFYIDEGQREYLLSLPKKVIICEAGYAESGDTDEKALYMETIYDGLEEYDELIAVVFFNVDVDENLLLSYIPALKDTIITVDQNRLFKFTNNDKYLQVFYDGIRRLRAHEILNETRTIEN